MRRLILWCSVSLGACSATGPSATQQVGLDPSRESVDAVEVARADTRNFGDEDRIASDDAEVIFVAEVPTVPVADAAPQAARRVCRRVQRTGSHRYRKICYTESEIESSTLKAKEVFGELHRQQQIPGSN